MSDNITREPYRNAWYKQLADAVKKHNEEIAEMRPHLVPEVGEDDNGKILIAGEDGAFDWGQPPEELPVITEGDEGKVLKVDEGVPKWLDDTDSEYLFVTITRSGSGTPENPYVYTADKTYTEIRPYAEKGKVVVFYNKNMYHLNTVDTTSINFEGQLNTSTVEYGAGGEVSARMLARINNKIITINSDNTISYVEQRDLPRLTVVVTDGQTLVDQNYNGIKTFISYTLPCDLIYNNKFLHASKYNSAKTEFDFVNEDEGIKAHIDANKLVTITEIPKDLFVTVTQSGTTYTANHAYNEIRSAIESGKNVIVTFNDRYYNFSGMNPTKINFDDVLTISATQPVSVSGVYNAGLTTLTQDRISFTESAVTKLSVLYFNIKFLNVTNNITISADDYNLLKSFPSMTQVVNDNKYFILSKINSSNTEFDFVCASENLKAHIDASRLVTITTI